MRKHFLLIPVGIIIILALLYSCGPAVNDTVSGPEIEVRPDSIMMLLELSENKVLTLDARQKLLKRALSLASLVSNDSMKTRYLSKLSLAFLRLPDSTLFRSTNSKVIDMAVQSGDTSILAEAHWDLAALFGSGAIPDSAFYHYSEANNYFNQVGADFMSARMLYNMAVIQAEAKDYTGSEINTVKAIELLKPLKENYHLYMCYNNLGSITKELEEYDRALEYYQQAFTYQQKIEEHNTYNLSLENNIGVVFQEMGQHPKAINYFRKVVSEPNLESTNPRLFARALNNLTYSQHQFDKGADLSDRFKRAVKILDSISDYQGLGRAHFNGAQYYKNVNDTAHALVHANLAMENALKSKNNKRLLETMELMVSLDPDNAVAHTQAYIKLDDSLQREERAIRNKFARIRFETDEFIAQNELLARQRQLWIGVAAGIFLFAFSVLIIIIQRIRNQRLKFQQQQQEANQEIFNLMLAQNQKLEEGKQSEQKRISEELHDGILGELNGVRMVLLGLNKKADEAAMALRAQAISKLQEIQEEIRTISHALSDASYRKFHNFVMSLEDLVKNMGDAAGMATTTTYDEDIDWDALKGDVKINIYRIVQECLQNSVKHAQAENITLDLHGNSKFLEVTINDDGRGFNNSGAKKGIGHKNITSRVQKLHGSWKITSSPGKGTTVKIKVPYNEIGGDPKRNALSKRRLQEV